MSFNAIVLEKPSTFSQHQSEEVASQSIISTYEKNTLKQIKKSVFGEQEPRKKRKRKGPKQPNPLSVKKKKKVKIDPNQNKKTEEEGGKKRRKRKRVKIAKHVKEHLQQSAGETRWYVFVTVQINKWTPLICIHFDLTKHEQFLLSWFANCIHIMNNSQVKESYRSNNMGESNYNFSNLWRSSKRSQFVQKTFQGTHILQLYFNGLNIRWVIGHIIKRIQILHAFSHIFRIILSTKNKLQFFKSIRKFWKRFRQNTCEFS